MKDKAKAHFRIREFDSDPTQQQQEGSSAVLEAKLVLENDDSWVITEETHVQSGNSTARRLLQTPLTVAKELFLPIGFPTSVRSGYLEYQCYDSLQGLCSYLRGVMCSAQLLQAAGVGDEAATAWGAALTWALKDGMGMMGGLLFSYCASPLFDAHVKEFRLFADLINDVALTLDMLAPYYSQSLLLLSSASTLCKTLCGMSAAATKANITVHFAMEGNMADLNAKESTQETLVSLMGMLCGVTLARWLRDYEKSHPEFTEQIQWTTFTFLTLVHVWANWKGVCILRLRSLNRERAEIVLSQWTAMVSAKNKAATPYISFPSPEQVNESLITSTRKMLFPGRLRFNCRLRDMIHKNSPSKDYIAWYATHQKYILSVNYQGQIQVCLFRGAKNADELQAFCHALVLLQHTANHSLSADDWENKTLELGQLVNAWFQKSSPKASSLPPRLAQAGWEVDGRLYLGFSRRRTEIIMKYD